MQLEPGELYLIKSEIFMSHGMHILEFKKGHVVFFIEEVYDDCDQLHFLYFLYKNCIYRTCLNNGSEYITPSKFFEKLTTHSTT
jgi:hypothetical protein